MRFGERLYQLRKEKNISQEELAELLDVSRQSISKWENDKAYPEMTRLLFMSDYFNVSLDYLMRGTEPDKKTQEPPTTPYKAKNLSKIWNSFVSNLSSKQRKLITLLYFLVVCVCIAIISSFLYGTGYAIGKALAYILN